MRNHICELSKEKQMSIYIGFTGPSSWVCEDIDEMNDFHNCKIYGIKFCPFCGVELK